MNPRDDFFPKTEAPSLFWRSASYQTILVVAALCRGFLFGLNKTEVNGLPGFLELLKSRSDYKTRRRGLVTVSNHISVLDDPLLWGILPLSFAAVHGHMNHRWTLASHDIAFKNAFSSHFFTLGQTLPTHRFMHSSHGGLNQPTMAEAVRLLSKSNPALQLLSPHSNLNRHTTSHTPSWPRDCVDPFSDLSPAPWYPSYWNDERYFLQPSRYVCNSYSWVHIFPEGFTHQAEDKIMRYFKWGVSRLILEPPECPDLVPIFIEGTDQVMHESRKFPRFIPRIGKKITVTIGEQVDTEAVFGDLRARWKALVAENYRMMAAADPNYTSITKAGTKRDYQQDEQDVSEMTLGLLTTFLLEHPEAVEIRIECARRVREQVLKVRRSRGLPDEDPKWGRVETWMREGPKKEGQMDDGTWVKDT